MGDNEQTIQDVETQRLLELYFASASEPRSRAADKTAKHIDADTLAAFVESSLSLRESEPVVAHLVDCGFCRKSSAELIRLQNEFSTEPVNDIVRQGESVTISEVVSGWLHKLLGTSDATVFAHEESEEEKEKSEKTDPGEKE
ncbi:MAG TPA: hypothetical protein VJV05_00035 [Pyrinomonadaceae bacterium]|nr:hypothetical protein [Pyrinomonadaceae bacterium]